MVGFKECPLCGKFHAPEIGCLVRPPPTPQKLKGEVAEKKIEKKPAKERPSTDVTPEVLAGYREYRRLYMKRYRAKKREENSDALAKSEKEDYRQR